MKVYYADHPNDAKHYTTEQLREHYLKEEIFLPDTIELAYSHVDRIIFGGAMPVSKALKLEAGDELRADYFLQRRELGTINIGGAGTVTVDGTVYQVAQYDGLYIGMGAKDVTFASADANHPAKFYINSCPAHHTYPTKLVTYQDAIHHDLGSVEGINHRQLNQYIHPDVLETCQLCMGFTRLEEGSAWNTMPCHTHERRMEVYLYFDMEEDTRVFHMMGQPQETRHLVMKNEQAVISPSWSIHSGVGTKRYTFIWGMCGENKDFDDMDFIPMDGLK